MRNVMQALVIILVLVAVLGASFAWTYYKYNDCVAVGHTQLYCIGRIFLG